MYYRRFIYVIVILLGNNVSISTYGISDESDSSYEVTLIEEENDSETFSKNAMKALKAGVETTTAKDEDEPREPTKKLVKHADEADDDVLDYDWSTWCKFQANGFDCDGHGFGVARFFYDTQMQDCLSFSFGKACPHNINYFDILSECQSKCRYPGTADIPLNMSAKVYCRLQPDFGTCNDYFPSWYFDITQRTCRGFSWSGCGGNKNRFTTKRQCKTVCGDSVEY